MVSLGGLTLNMVVSLQIAMWTSSMHSADLLCCSTDAVEGYVLDMFDEDLLEQ